MQSNDSRTCDMCGTPLSYLPNPRLKRFCSSACYHGYRAQSGRLDIACEVCGTIVNVKRSVRNPRFCSFACRVRAQQRTPGFTDEDVSRFWQKVDRSGSDQACWLWTASVDERGYGKVWWNRRIHVATHVSWILAFGDPVPPMVCHHCDTPGCVNPSHLFAGNSVINMADMVQKGRSARGERAFKAKLTEDNVRQIRQLALKGVSVTEIAATFGVHSSTIYAIRLGKAWKHVA